MADNIRLPLIIQNSNQPIYRENKLFYWIITQAPVAGVRYFLTRNREIHNFITEGIELYTYNALTPNFPQTIELEGVEYNTLEIADANKIRVTWVDYDGNWLELDKPLISYNKFPSLANNVLLDTRNYYMRIFAPRSYFVFNDAALITALPIAIPMGFYWKTKMR